MTPPRIRQAHKVAFIQPYSLADANGGARILRSLVQNAPVEVTSCNSSPWPASREPFDPEFHLPFRPHFGRVESTRFAWLPTLMDSFWMRQWIPQLHRFLEEQKATHLHVVPHAGLDFAAALVCARMLSLPLSVSIHDHPRYCFRGIKGAPEKLNWVGKIWEEAQNRFVVSEKMGDAMNAEFGERTFQVITDGVEGPPFPLRTREPGILRIYFMGLFHQSYAPNLQCLVEALGELARRIPGHQTRLTLRCGSTPDVDALPGVEIEVLPFASEDQVRLDMESADLLYLPLPFGEAYRDFVAYSLSTKMVTYLGSGRTIFYHGPADSVAGSLLQENRAAVVCATLDSSSIADTLGGFAVRPSSTEIIRTNALTLAGDQFNAGFIRTRYWQIMLKTSQQTCLTS
jgi:hypothetical protein